MDIITKFAFNRGIPGIKKGRIPVMGCVVPPHGFLIKVCYEGSIFNIKLFFPYSLKPNLTCPIEKIDIGVIHKP